MRLQAQCSFVVSAFPYSEDFESGPGSWFSGGINNDWALGTPAKAVINSAGSGNISWISGGLNVPFYNYGERSWVQSPCFDFSNLNYPVLSFKIFWELENQFDGGNLLYTTDGGIIWKTLGTASEPDNCINQNWYNTRNVTNLSGFTNPAAGWSGTVQANSGSCRGGNGLGEWKDAIHCISQLAGESSVSFRITLGSGTTCNDYDGIAFDLFQIYESDPIPFQIGYNCISASEIIFNEDLATCHEQWIWDFGDPASTANNSSLSSPSHTFSGPGDYSVTLRASAGCIPEDSASTTIKILSIDSEVISVTCRDGDDGEANVQVKDPPIGISYLWNTDPVQSGTKANNLKAGNYIVTLSAPGICDHTVDMNVGYGPDAFPSVTLGSDTVICPGNPIKLYPGIFTDYLWQDGSTDSVLSVYSGGKYTVRISNDAGCHADDELIVDEDCLGDILFPNSFTPNHDGLNETFRVVGNLITSYELNIFNRWGERIFSSVFPEEGWNGEIKGVEQEEGIYVFKVNYTIRSGHALEKIGKVVLIR